MWWTDNSDPTYPGCFLYRFKVWLSVVFCSRWSVFLYQDAARTQMWGSVGLHRIRCVSGVAQAEGEETSASLNNQLTAPNNCKVRSLSFASCTFEDDCINSDWLSIPEDYQEKMVSHRVAKEPTGQVEIKDRVWTIISCVCRLFVLLNPHIPTSLRSHWTSRPTWPQAWRHGPTSPVRFLRGPVRFTAPVALLRCSHNAPASSLLAHFPQKVSNLW